MFTFSERTPKAAQAEVERILASCDTLPYPPHDEESFVLIGF